MFETKHKELIPAALYLGTAVQVNQASGVRTVTGDDSHPATTYQPTHLCDSLQRRWTTDERLRQWLVDTILDVARLRLAEARLRRDHRHLMQLAESGRHNARHSSFAASTCGSMMPSGELSALSTLTGSRCVVLAPYYLIECRAHHFASATNRHCGDLFARNIRHPSCKHQHQTHRCHPRCRYERCAQEAVSNRALTCIPGESIEPLIEPRSCVEARSADSYPRSSSTKNSPSGRSFEQGAALGTSRISRCQSKHRLQHGTASTHWSRRFDIQIRYGWICRRRALQPRLTGRQKQKGPLLSGPFVWLGD